MIYIKSYLFIIGIFAAITYFGALVENGFEYANESMLKFFIYTPINSFILLLPVSITVITKIYAFIIGVNDRSLDNYAFLSFMIIILYYVFATK